VAENLIPLKRASLPVQQGDSDPKLTTVYFLQMELNQHLAEVAKWSEAEAYATRMKREEEEIIRHLQASITGLSKRGEQR